MKRGCSRSLTQKVLRPLCRLDDLCAHCGTADAIKGVISSVDDLKGEEKTWL